VVSKTFIKHKYPQGTIKTEEEIELIKESCRIVAETLVLLKDYVKPDETTLNLDKVAEEYIRSRGGIPAFKGYETGGLVFPNSLCISINDEVIHGIPNNRRLKVGDLVSIDCGVLKNGYYGDSAITYGVGEISEDDKKLMAVTEKALELGIEQVKRGNNVYDISRAIQSYVEMNGFSLTREYCGHGLGKSLHEFPAIPNYVPPLLHRDNFPNVKLENNMVIAIEPMVHKGRKEIKIASDKWTVLTRDGSKAAHFEHTVVVNDNKAIILTYR